MPAQLSPYTFLKWIPFKCSVKVRTFPKETRGSHRRHTYHSSSTHSLIALRSNISRVPSRCMCSRRTCWAKLSPRLSSYWHSRHTQPCTSPLRHNAENAAKPRFPKIKRSCTSRFALIFVMLTSQHFLLYFIEWIGPWIIRSLISGLRRAPWLTLRFWLEFKKKINHWFFFFFGKFKQQI